MVADSCTTLEASILLAEDQERRRSAYGQRVAFGSALVNDGIAFGCEHCDTFRETEVEFCPSCEEVTGSVVYRSDDEPGFYSIPPVKGIAIDGSNL